MMSNQILDNEELQMVNEPIKKYRIGAIILEAIPLLLILTGFFIGNLGGVFLSILALLAVYVFGGWYIFKGDKYRAKDIVFVTMTALFSLFPIVISLLYRTLSWPGANEMFMTSRYILPIFIMICIGWYFFHRHRLLEWRLSLKLLSRIVVFGMLLFLFM